MVTAVSSRSRTATDARQTAARSLTIGMTAAGIATFALLYAPQPVLPQIADAYHLNAGSASLAVGVGTAGLAIAVLPIATLSEIIGRRKIILASLAISVLLGLIIPFAPDFTTLLVLRGLQGAAIAGFPGVAAAFLVERLGSGGVAGAVGAMVAGNVVGGLLGRLAAGLTTDVLGWQLAMTSSAAVALVCLAVALFYLRKQRRLAGPDTEAPSTKRGLLEGLADAIRNPLLLAQYGVALFGMGSFVAIYNAGTFRLTGDPLNLAPAVASLVFLAYAMGAVSSSFTGRVVRRFGRRRSVVVALLVTVAGAALTMADSLAVVICGFVVLTGGFFGAHALSSGWAAAAASPSGRGQASGLYTLAYYVGGSVGGTAGSVVYAHFGWPALIAIVAVWLGIAAIGILAVRTKTRA